MGESRGNAFSGVFHSLQAAPARELRRYKGMTETSGERGGSSPAQAHPLPGGVRSRNRLTFTLGLITVVLALCSGLATYFILTGLTPIVPTHRVVVGVLLINLLLVLAMIVLIAWQVTG